MISVTDDNRIGSGDKPVAAPRDKGARRVAVRDALPYVGLILLQSVLYGYGNPITKIAYESVTVFWFLAIRFTMASAVFLLLFGRKIFPRLKSTRFRDFARLYLPSAVCMTVAAISMNYALKLTDATTVGFLMSLPILFTPLLARIFLHRHYDWRHLPFHFAIVVGLYLLCSTSTGTIAGGFKLPTLSFGPGEILAVVTSLGLAGVLISSEKALGETDIVTLSTVQVLLTAAVSLICALLFEQTDVAAVFTAIRPEAWAVIAYMAIFCNCVAYACQYAALKHLASQNVAILQTTQPILTAIFSYLVLGETLPWIGWVGAGIIIVCVAVETARLEI